MIWVTEIIYELPSGYSIYDVGSSFDYWTNYLLMDDVIPNNPTTVYEPPLTPEAFQYGTPYVCNYSSWTDIVNEFDIEYADYPNYLYQVLDYQDEFVYVFLCETETDEPVWGVYIEYYDVDIAMSVLVRADYFLRYIEEDYNLDDGLIYYLYGVGSNIAYNDLLYDLIAFDVFGFTLLDLATISFFAYMGWVIAKTIFKP